MARIILIAARLTAATQRITLIGVALLAAGSPGFAQPIEHSPAPCMDTEAFPLIEARASTAEGARAIRGLKVRFKTETDSGWYEVAFRPPSGALFQAALPKPLPEAGRVIYVIESSAPEFQSPEHVVNVLMGGCPGARSAPSAVTDDVRVERTASDQSEFPNGFSSDGIRAGGTWSRTTLGVLAAAGAGAGVAALVIAGEDPPPVVGGELGPPSVIRACFTPDPIPDIESGETILFDASCSMPASVMAYAWDFGDGQTASGSSVEHLFRPGGIYTVRLTVSEGQRTDNTSRVIRVRATPVACFTTTPDPPRITANDSINFNGECSVGDRDGGASAITNYDWDFGDGRPHAEGVFVSRQFTEPDLYGVTLTVTNGEGRQDTTTQFIVVERQSVGTTESRFKRTEVSFTSHLELGKGNQNQRAQISLNNSTAETTSGTTPQQHHLPARPGENIVEARLLTQPTTPGRWHFNFQTTRNLIPGSLKIESGEVLTLDQRRAVFRIPAKTTTVIRFRFTLTK